MLYKNVHIWNIYCTGEYETLVSLKPKAKAKKKKKKKKKNLFGYTSTDRP